MKSYRWFVVVAFVVVGMVVFAGFAFAQAKKATPSPAPAKSENQGTGGAISIGLIDINKIFDSHPNTQKLRRR